MVAGVSARATPELPDGPVELPDDAGRTRVLVVRRAASRQLTAELLTLAESHEPVELKHPGQVAAAWLTEYPSRNTRQAYARDLAGFFVWCADRPVHVFDVTRQDLAAFLATTKPDGKPFAPKTQERRLATLSGFYNYALDAGLIEKHPKGHRRPLNVTAKEPARAPALSKPEFERLVRTAQEHSPTAHAIVFLLGLYGLRVSEVCDLQITAIGWHLGQPVLRIAGKGRAANETRPFPIPPDVGHVLDTAINGRTTGPVLLKSTGKPYLRQEISSLLTTLTRRAQIPTKLTPHGLRSTFITLALNDGVALRDVQDAARHADPRTTRHYDRDAGALNRHPIHRLIGLTDTTSFRDSDRDTPA